MLFKEGVPKKFAKFTRNHLCQSLFFNKVAGLRSVTLFKKRLWQRRFPVNFAKFLRTPFTLNTSGGFFCMKKVKLPEGCRVTPRRQFTFTHLFCKDTVYKNYKDQISQFSKNGLRIMLRLFHSKGYFSNGMLENFLLEPLRGRYS